MKDDTKLIATRISPEAFEVLQIALLAEQADSMQELLRPVIEEYANVLGREPEVQAVKTNLQAYRDRKQGVKRLPRNRRSAQPARSRAKKPDADDSS